MKNELLKILEQMEISLDKMRDDGMDSDYDRYLTEMLDHDNDLFKKKAETKYRPQFDRLKFSLKIDSCYSFVNVIKK